jgi:tetratricopeptide (TPR) repeat protein
MRRWALVIVAAGAVTGCSGTPPADTTQATAGGSVTFAEHVAPILYANCVSCHRPNQVAPFSLIEYADAKSRADDIAEVIQARKMPPWMPAPGEHAFVGERRLRPEQIDVISRWAKAGAPEGDRSKLPSLAAWRDGWQAGTPDLVATMPRGLTLQPGHHDRYRQIVFPLALPGGRYVRAVELRTDGAPIHHAVVRIDRTHASRRRDGADGEPGFEGVMAPDVRNPDGHFLGWTPGQGPIVSPPGMPWRLEPGSDLVVEVHLIPGDAPQRVQPSVGLFFTDEAPRETPVELTMGVKTIDIPAGEPAYRVTDSYVFPVDVTLLSIYPHAHYLGRDIQVVATFPDGSSSRLLHIPRWDFHWQQEYRFVTPVALPRGTSLTMQYTYDNSAANADNPTSPPRRVTYGLRSVDEMGNLAMQVLPKVRADGRRLVKAFLERDARATVAGAELRIAVEPGHAPHYVDLGRALLDLGRPAEAVAALEHAIRLDLALASAHDYLGRALAALARLPEAFSHLNQAVTLAPKDEVFLLDLGKVLSDAGRQAEAMTAFNRALTINPEYSQAHEGVGVALVRAGKFADAIMAFRRAVSLSPESPSAENGLAVALAQAGRPQEALEHVRRALDIDPDYVPAKDNLARLTKKE